MRRIAIANNTSLWAIALILLFACGPSEKSLIGQWAQYTDSGSLALTFEFFEDHTCLIEQSSSRMVCEWSLLRDGRVMIAVKKEKAGSAIIVMGSTQDDQLILERGFWRGHTLIRVGSELEAVIKRLFESENLIRQGQYAEAIVILTHEADRGNSRAQNSLAWVLSTCKVAAHHDGKEAVRYARKAVDQTPGNANYLDTLAAAYARAGDFQEAVRSQERALEVLTGERFRQEFEDRLALYKRGEVFTEK